MSDHKRTSPKEDDRQPPYLFGFACLTFIILLWLLTPVILHEAFGITEDNHGTFGDMFGWTNSLFSGLAFGGIIFALLLQQHELTSQKQAAEFNRRATTRQGFETMFFQMLVLHHRIVSAVQYGSNYEGRRAIRQLYRRLKALRKETADKDVTYGAFYREYGSMVGHYFRNLYTIVKIIDAAEVDNKKIYLGILFAQLSKFELLLLFYNCLDQLGAKFKPYVENYGLLENMSWTDVCTPNDLRLYSDSAFGENIDSVRGFIESSKLKPAMKKTRKPTGKPKTAVKSSPRKKKGQSL